MTSSIVIAPIAGSPVSRRAAGGTTRKQAWGFTLIEVVVTVAIIALLASIAAPLTETVIRRSKEHDLRNALMTIRAAIDAYKEATEATPPRVQKGSDESGYPKSLEVLVEGVPDMRSPTGAKIYFLRRLPRDPFADASLPAKDSWGLRSYESPPDSPRPGKDVFDVHSNATGVGLNGIPYREW